MTVSNFRILKLRACYFQVASDHLFYFDENIFWPNFFLFSFFKFLRKILNFMFLQFKVSKWNNNTTIIKSFLKPINHFCSNSQEASWSRYIFVKWLRRHLPLRNLMDLTLILEIAEAKKVILLQKIFEPIAQWVQGWWKGEEVRTWGDTFVWHLNWDKCPRLFSCWTSEKKSEDGKMGLWITLNCKNLAWP